MKARAAGFTLVELLVAITIFAVIGIMATAGLHRMAGLKSQNDDAMRRLRQVQLAMDIMSRDFEQLAPRPVRDGLGGMRSALTAGPQNVPPIEFTRAGWVNPLGITRSTQQRVAYSLEDGKLIRSWWSELDGSIQRDPQKQELLADVESVKVQYYAPGAGAYTDVWPPVVNGQATNPAQLPAAVSVTVSLKDWGTITRIVEVASP